MDLASAFAVTLITDPIVALLWAIPIAFILLYPSLRLWWIHAPLVLILAVGAVIHHPDRALAFDTFAIGVAVFPVLCRQIPSDALVLRYGMLWFALFALMAAMIEAGSVSQQTAPDEPPAPNTHDTIFAGGKRMKHLLVLASLAGAAFGAASPAQASDWGCEVLLCAASSNPSWQGVQACHPPMHRLISEMSRPGFSWPTCPGAGTGAPGFERYEECPTGWHPTFDQTRESGRGSLGLCARTVNTCGGRFSHRADCERTETQPRPVRSEPYFFDIRNQDGSGTIRHWFNLRR